MIQWPDYPVLGGGPNIRGIIVALSTTDTLITPGPDGNEHWDPATGWDEEWWAASWALARADLQSTFEEAWGDLRDKLYWYITAPEDPEAAGHADYQSPAFFFRDALTSYLAS